MPHPDLKGATLIPLLALTLALGPVLRGPVLHGPGSLLAQDSDWCSEVIRQGGNRVCQIETFTARTAAGIFAVNARPNGSISVEVSSGPAVEITARVQARGWSRRAADRLAEQVLINALDGRVWVEGPRVTGFRGGWSVDLSIRVPHGTELDAESTNGAIRISGVEGSARARTTNGAIVIAQARGSVEARSTNGGITVELTSPPGSGDRLDLRTTNGGVRVGLPQGSSPTLEARTTNGGISSDFPLSQGQAERRRWTGVLGGEVGVGELRVQTTNGGIRIVTN